MNGSIEIKLSDTVALRGSPALVFILRVEGTVLGYAWKQGDGAWTASNERSGPSSHLNKTFAGHNSLLEAVEVYLAWHTYR